jgi:mxaD protein
MILNRKLLLPFLLLLEIGTVNAHGPVRQKLTESITIKASSEQVWKRLKDFGSVEWLSMVENVDASGGNEVGASRQLTLKGGGTISEQIKKYNEEKMMYSYKITDMSIVKMIQHSGKEEPVKVLPVTDFTASITVKADGDTSKVMWKAAYYRGYMNNNPPDDLNEDAARNSIKAFFSEGLENLKAISESDQPIKESSTETKAEKSTPQKITSDNEKKDTSAFDSDYPASNFEPKVIFIDKSQAKKEVVFDKDYPAAYFEPKIIFP